MRKLLSKLFSKKKKDENHNHGKHHPHHKHHGKKWELIDDLIEDYNSNDWTY